MGTIKVNVINERRNKMSQTKDYIKCTNHPDCFGHYRKGLCAILKDNDFGERDCPFYAPKEKRTKGRKKKCQ